MNGDEFKHTWRSQTESHSETSIQNVKEKSKSITNNTKWGRAQENLQNDLWTHQMVTGRFAHFPVRPESFRPESFSPPSRFAPESFRPSLLESFRPPTLSRFAHYLVSRFAHFLNLYLIQDIVINLQFLFPSMKILVIFL